MRLGYREIFVTFLVYKERFRVLAINMKFRKVMERRKEHESYELLAKSLSTTLAKHRNHQDQMADQSQIEEYKKKIAEMEKLMGKQIKKEEVTKEEVKKEERKVKKRKQDESELESQTEESDFENIVIGVSEKKKQKAVSDSEKAESPAPQRVLVEVSHVCNMRETMSNALVVLENMPVEFTPLTSALKSQIDYLKQLEKKASRSKKKHRTGEVVKKEKEVKEEQISQA